ncbi:replication initiator [Kitasatospora sp. NPDC048545]|uniref:replication initiator n=1 Tax=Kitasatospora sp. NPDC048545 TaxID=3157208 RepID=UPI0034034ED0
MIRTAWALGTRPELADLKLRAWAHMLGFRGHFSTKTRNYSTTLAELRQARADWQRSRQEPRSPDLTTRPRSSCRTWHSPASASPPELVRLAAAVAPPTKRTGVATGA